MNLRPTAELKKSLAVRSIKKWPEALLPLAWRGELLCGFSATTSLAFELNSEESLTKVAQTFLEIHSDLCIVDLVELKKNTLAVSWGTDFFNELLRQMAHGQESQWLKLLTQLESVPQVLLIQWQQKHLQYGDLRPLLSLEQDESLWKILEGASFSKSEWTQVIEWFTELLLMKKHEELSALEPLVSKQKEFFVKLKELRYPETAKKDRLETDFWKKLPWPKNTQAEFRRQGDQTKTYVSMNFSSLQDLKKIAKDLHQMADQQECEH